MRNGRLIRAAKAAKQRGVLFDVGHGAGSFDFTVCEPALMQGAHVDTISSDIHAASINTPGNPTMPWVMSKFLALGLSLEEVLRRATSSPRESSAAPRARYPPGRRAGNKRTGTRKLVPVLTVKAGRPFVY